MEIAEIKEKLAQALKPKRFEHTLAVCETGVLLAENYGVDEIKTAIACLLHDSGREFSGDQYLFKAREFGLPVDAVEEQQTILLHAKLGAYLAKEKYGVTDPEILEAITFHSTGKAGMSELAKIVFVADMIEPQRNFPGVDELRKLAYVNLDAAMLAGYDSTIMHLIRKGQLIHPACIEGRNELIIDKLHTPGAVKE